MSKFVTIANWQICCFIAKFPINLEFWYKLLGLSWGQSLHQNCKDVKLHITSFIAGLAFISPAIFFTWHNLTCVHWLTSGRAHTGHHQICNSLHWSEHWTLNTSHWWYSSGWRPCWLSHQGAVVSVAARAADHPMLSVQTEICEVWPELELPSLYPPPLQTSWADSDRALFSVI